jgi:hypothetical protein
MNIYLLEFDKFLFSSDFDSLAKLQTNINDFRKKFAKILLEHKIDEADLIIESNRTIADAENAEDMGKAIGKYGVGNFLKKRFSKQFVGNMVGLAKKGMNTEHAEKSGKYSSRILVIYLRIDNHWVGFICHRFGKKIEFLLLDSKNVNFLYMNPKQIRQYVDSQTVIKNWSQKKIESETQMIYDYQSALNLIMDAFSGELYLLDHMLYEEVYKKLPLFKNHGSTKRYTRMMEKHQNKKAFVFETVKVSAMQRETSKQGNFLQSEFKFKNKQHVLQFHIKDNEKFEGFARNENPAEVQYPKDESFEDNEELLKELKFVNDRLKVYKTHINNLSFKGRTDLHKAERDIDVFNKIFGYVDEEENSKETTQD